MPDVAMNYQMMEDMGRTCSQAASSLEESMSAVQGIAQKLSTTFQGNGGDAMQQALNQTLKSKLQEFHDKMTEMAKDLATAAQDTRDGITSSKSKYA
jgi:WXG100 family type VII secretion target